MAVLVISGSGRGVGKTAVGCGLMAALPELGWVGVKVSPHGHGKHGDGTGIKLALVYEGNSNSGANGLDRLKREAENSTCTDVPVWEEQDPMSSKDTGRYLMAGARRAFLVSGGADCLCGIRREAAESLLVESNRESLESLAGAHEALLRVAVLGGIVTEWKKSLWETVEQVDGVVLTGGFPVEQLPWELRRRRLFWMMPGEWISHELIKFVRGRLVDPIRAELH